MKVWKIIGPIIIVVMLSGLLLGASCSSKEGPEGTQGPQGLKGDTGDTGIGIESAVDNGDGTFTLNFTDGTSFTTSDLTGPQGDTGATGDTGLAGPQGEQGPQGNPGPNMILAMGNIDADGTINSGYNIDSCAWDSTNHRYMINLTDINYYFYDYITMVTAVGDIGEATYSSVGGNLLVYLYDHSGNWAQYHFSFMVLGTP